MLNIVEAILFSAIDFAPAVIFGSMSATLCERAGIVQVGVEGMMRAGAFGAAVAAVTMPTPVGVLMGMASGALLASVHAYLCIRWKSEQVVSGMALNLVALALGSFLLEALFSPQGTPPVTQLAKWDIPGVHSLPMLKSFSHHSLLTYVAFVAPWGFHYILWKTPWGLRLRACGENPHAAASMGISVHRLRYVCVVGSGLLAGLGGAMLSTSTLDRFESHMPAGLGFMAVAAMVFGRWSFLGALAASCFFALAHATRIGLSSSAPDFFKFVPQGVWMATPYLLTLLLLTWQGQRTLAPKALGQPFE